MHDSGMVAARELANAGVAQAEASHRGPDLAAGLMKALGARRCPELGPSEVVSL